MAVFIDSERLDKLEGEVSSLFAMVSADLGRRAADIRMTSAMFDAALTQQLRSIQLRRSMMPKVLHKEVAWTVLLIVYDYAYRRKPLSITGAIAFGQFPETTALHALSHLEAAGLLVRQPDPDDRRRTWITVTDEARKLLQVFAKTLLGYARQ